MTSGICSVAAMFGDWKLVYGLYFEYLSSFEALDEVVQLERSLVPVSDDVSSVTTGSCVCIFELTLLHIPATW